SVIPGDSLPQKKPMPANDSLTARQYGSLASFLTGKPSTTTLENDVLELTFSSNATFDAVRLKNFKTYHQQPLYLVHNGNNAFSLFADYEGKTVDLYSLNYEITTDKKRDTTFVTFAAKLSADAYLKHVYAIPAKGYL